MKTLSLVIASSIFFIATSASHNALGAAASTKTVVYPITATEELGQLRYNFTQNLQVQESEKRALGYSPEQIRVESLHAMVRFIASKKVKDLIERARFEEEFSSMQTERLLKEDQDLKKKRMEAYLENQAKLALENERKAAPPAGHLPALTARPTPPSSHVHVGIVERTPGTLYRSLGNSLPQAKITSATSSPTPRPSTSAVRLPSLKGNAR